MGIKQIFGDITNPAPQGMRDFLAQSPGNTSTPYSVNYYKKGFDPSEEATNNEELPKDVEAAIERIKEAGSTEEKVAIAHDFTQSYIEEKETPNETTINNRFMDIVKNPSGDCDDHADFTRGLLIRGGVNPKDIYTVDTHIKISTDANSISSAHRTLIVKSEGEYLLSDNNISGIVQIDPKDNSLNITLPNEDGSAAMNGNGAITAKYEMGPIATITDGRGIGFMNIDNHKILLNRHLEEHPEQISPKIYDLYKDVWKEDPPQEALDYYNKHHSENPVATNIENNTQQDVSPTQDPTFGMA